MDDKQFSHLLQHPENEYLDFKAKQYPFAKATDYQKSELLKDLLAFSNTKREHVAHIVIGVKAPAGGAKEMLGLDPADPNAHLDDAHLQQFVGSKVNTSLPFQYEELVFEGKGYGIFTIRPCDFEQDGFRYLIEDYGQLRKNDVWSRLISSSFVLTPEQVYKLGQGSVTNPTPSFIVQLLNSITRSPIDPNQAIVTTFFEYDRIPDFSSRRTVHDSPLGELYTRAAMAIEATYAFQDNENAYRETAAYHRFEHAYTPITIAIQNTGRVYADKLRIELETNDASLLILDECEKPTIPQETKLRMHIPMPKGISRFDESKVLYERKGSTTRITTGEFDLQPGRGLYLEPTLFLGAKNSTTVPIVGKLLGRNIAHPIPLCFNLTFKVNKVLVGESQLLELHWDLQNRLKDASKHNQ